MSEDPYDFIYGVFMICFSVNKNNIFRTATEVFASEEDLQEVIPRSLFTCIVRAPAYITLPIPGSIYMYKNPAMTCAYKIYLK